MDDLTLTDDLRPVVGYEGLYSVTSLGVVHNVASKKIVRGTLYSRGYRMICLCKFGAVERRLLHRIVAESFIGPRPPGMQIDHIDGDKSNNSASNLRYCSPRDNIRNAMRHGQTPTGERNGQTKLTTDQVVEIINAKRNGGRFWGLREFAARFGVSRAQIYRAASGTTFQSCPAAIRARGQREGE